jgi:hypothetical protein
VVPSKERNWMPKKLDAKRKKLDVDLSIARTHELIFSKGSI